MKLKLPVLFAVVLALGAFTAQAAGVDVPSFIAAHPDVAAGLAGLAMMGAVKTQGTDLYAVDPLTGALLEVGCVTSINGVDTTVEQVEVTCLADQARRYMAGLATPGAATFGINFDPSDESHVRLHQLKVLGENIQWAIGFSDGTTDPTADSAGMFVLPGTRSWLTFEGFMNSFPFNFEGNNVVQSTVGIQISGEPELHEMT